MSTLIVDEMYPGLVFDQPIRLERSANLAHVRVWVYLHNILQDGDFRLQVMQGATVLATSTLNYTEINAVKSLAYAHGYIRFDFNSLALFVDEGNLTEDFTLRFEMINHTRDTANFLGVSRNWEIKYYDTYGDGVIDNQAPNDFVEPGGIELYLYETY